MRQLIHILSLLIIILSGCTPDPINIKVDPAPKKLVIASQIIPSKTMLVAVTRNFSALKNFNDGDTINNNTTFLDSVFVKNAFVTVQYFGKTDTLKMIAPGLYGSSDVLQYNYGSYYLEVYDGEAGLSANALTTLLPEVRFDTVYPVLIKNPGDTIVKVQMELRDNVQEENYYVINYIKKVNKVNGGIDLNQIFSLGSNAVQSYFDLLDDNAFTNGKLSLTKELLRVTAHDSIAISLSNISKGYYEFLSTYKRSGNLINQLTGEPINYPSNVYNGYGYFNAHYPDNRLFDLNKY